MISSCAVCWLISLSEVRGSLQSSNAKIVGVSCEEKTRLLNDYDHLESAFSATVSDLAKLAGTTTKHEYEVLKARTDLARGYAEKARKAFEEHVAEHGC
jgi:hypothetical protein